jgi:hypothetical protein
MHQAFSAPIPHKQFRTRRGNRRPGLRGLKGSKIGRLITQWKKTRPTRESIPGDPWTHRHLDIKLYPAQDIKNYSGPGDIMMAVAEWRTHGSPGTPPSYTRKAETVFNQMVRKTKKWGLMCVADPVIHRSNRHKFRIPGSPSDYPWYFPRMTPLSCSQCP